MKSKNRGRPKADPADLSLPHLTSAPTAEDLLKQSSEMLHALAGLLLNDDGYAAQKLSVEINDFLANQSGDPYEEQV